MIGRSTAKRIYFLLLRFLRRDQALLRDINAEDRLLVLNFHRVSPLRNLFWDPLHPRLFDAVLDFAKRHFEVSTFAQARLERSKRPRLIISFDDGYQDFVEHAAPILHAHGLRANQNVIPGCIRRGQPPWNVRMYDFLNAAPTALLKEMQVEGFTGSLKHDSPDARARFGLALSRFLKHRPKAEREVLWGGIESLMERAPAFPVTRVMNADAIREMATVHEIGSHSFSHESMEYESKAFFESDFDSCARYFRDDLNLPMTIYAFPNGSHRQEQVQFLLAQGIEHVLLTGERYASSAAQVYPRFTMYGDSTTELRFRALGYVRRGRAQVA